MRAIRPPRPRTSFTGRTWRAVRRACRWLSICRPRRVMTVIMCWRAAKWARSGCRFRTLATCGLCSTSCRAISCREPCRTTSLRNICRAGLMSFRRNRRCGSSPILFPTPTPKCPSGTRPTSARITCRKQARRRCRSWPSRWPMPSRSWTASRRAGRCRKKIFRRLSGAYRFL